MTEENKERITFDEMPLLVAGLVAKMESLEKCIRDMRLELRAVDCKVDGIASKPKHVPITISRASEITGKAVSTLYRYTANGLIPCYKNGKALLFYEDELVDWVRHSKCEELEEEYRSTLCRFVPLKSKDE